VVNKLCWKQNYFDVTSRPFYFQEDSMNAFQRFESILEHIIHFVLESQQRSCPEFLPCSQVFLCICVTSALRFIFVFLDKNKSNTYWSIFNWISWTWLSRVRKTAFIFTTPISTSLISLERFDPSPTNLITFRIRKDDIHSRFEWRGSAAEVHLFLYNNRA